MVALKRVGVLNDTDDVYVNVFPVVYHAETYKNETPNVEILLVKF